MTTAQGQQPPTETGPVRSLTRGQIAVFILATVPMIAVGIGGAIGTYGNAKAVLHRSETAIGLVAAGEGAVLVAAIVMIGVTMLGQAAPFVVRAALWALPIAAAVVGFVIAPNSKEAVVYGITPLAMTAAAEGISFLARRIVSHTSGIDVEAQRRNAETMRRIAYHAAQAERHPDPKVRKESELKAWKLMKEIGSADAQLGSGLITVQRDRLTQGADAALVTMLTGVREPAPAHTMSRALESGEPTSEPTVETALSPTALTPAHEPTRKPAPRELPEPRPIIQSVNQQIRREPVLTPAEPAFAKAAETTSETTVGEPSEPVNAAQGETADGEPGADETAQQVAELAQRLKAGERLTKTTAAQILGVSPATGGRRLKEARDRVSEGVGMYL